MNYALNSDSVRDSESVNDTGSCLITNQSKTPRLSHTARAVCFICNGKQLLDEMNVALSSLILCCIVTKRWKGVNFRQYFCLSMSAWGSVAESV